MATASLPGSEEERLHMGLMLEESELSADRLARALFDAEAREIEERPLRRPSATYRLQLHGGFPLDDATGVVDYLDALGVTDFYLSPYLTARPGSTHGYDVFDHGRINPEIGDETAHDRLVARLRQRGMGRLIDVVPNHMGIGENNRFWLDVLESGPQASSARFFDIDWKPVKDELEGRVLIPILEDLYGKVLEAGLLELERVGGSFWITYRDTRFPLTPRSYLRVLDHRVDDFRAMFDPEDDDALEFLSIRDSIRNLPPRDSMAAGDLDHVRREKEVIKRRIDALCQRSSDIRDYLDACVAGFRGTEGDAESFDALHALLEEQIYRLAYWRVAREEINYRRFFDVTELAGLRTEDPRIFDLTHWLIFRWVREGGVTGLRIDHPDGLADPLGYLQRLQERLFLQACHRRLTALEREQEWDQVAAPLRALYRGALAENPSSPLARRFPVVAEKILSRGETLPADWPIDGTVGYEFLNVLNGLFVDASASDEIQAIYRDFTGDYEPFEDLLNACKLHIEDEILASELNALTRQLNRVAEHNRRSRDFTLNDLRRVLREVIACFRIYRTYQRPGDPVAQRDRDAIAQAVARARHRLPMIDESFFAFLNDVLVFEGLENFPAHARPLWEQFVIRFQQTTGPVQAKGLEDTAFYRQFPLASLNEVGGDPARFGTSPAVFHALNDHRLNSWPGGLSPTATHDTKRGEDMRIRIDALSELADEWRTRLTRWSRWNARKKVELREALVPDAREEYLLYQTLIGAWPFDGPDDAPPAGFVTRIQDYMVKTAREAKRNTSWTDPDTSYTETLRRFVAEILEGPDAQPFLKDFLPFQRRVARIAVVHSLAQTLLKLTSPGVPDIYQGCELWDLRLVDPDNRTPVDYALRQRLLNEIGEQLRAGKPRAELAAGLLEHPDDGAVKLYLIATVLNHRKANQALYQAGNYRPLEASGDFRGNIVSFLRRHQGQSVVVVAPRLVARLMGEDSARLPLGSEAWADTALLLPEQSSASRWRNLLTDESIAVNPQGDRPAINLADVFRLFPGALLVEE